MKWTKSLILPVLVVCLFLLPAFAQTQLKVEEIVIGQTSLSETDIEVNIGRIRVAMDFGSVDWRRLSARNGVFMLGRFKRFT